MNTCVIRSWWILLSIIAASALATPYGRFVENYDEDQNARGLFREEAFVLSKRDKPTPNSVARLARMHSTVGIGKRNQQDSFLERMSKKEGISLDQDAWNTASGKTTNSNVNIANIDKFAKDVSELFEVFRTCPHALQYAADSKGSWDATQLKDLLNTCLNVAVLAKQMRNLP